MQKMMLLFISFRAINCSNVPAYRDNYYIPGEKNISLYWLALANRYQSSFYYAIKLVVFNNYYISIARPSRRLYGDLHISHGLSGNGVARVSSRIFVGGAMRCARVSGIRATGQAIGLGINFDPGIFYKCFVNVHQYRSG